MKDNIIQMPILRTDKDIKHDTQVDESGQVAFSHAVSNAIDKMMANLDAMTTDFIKEHDAYPAIYVSRDKHTLSVKLQKPTAVEPDTA